MPISGWTHARHASYGQQKQINEFDMPHHREKFRKDKIILIDKNVCGKMNVALMLKYKGSQV